MVEWLSSLISDDHKSNNTEIHAFRNLGYHLTSRYNYPAFHSPNILNLILTIKLKQMAKREDEL